MGSSSSQGSKETDNKQDKSDRNDPVTDFIQFYDPYTGQFGTTNTAPPPSQLPPPPPNYPPNNGPRLIIPPDSNQEPVVVISANQYFSQMRPPPQLKQQTNQSIDKEDMVYLPSRIVEALLNRNQQQQQPSFPPPPQLPTIIQAPQPVIQEMPHPSIPTSYATQNPPTIILQIPSCPQLQPVQAQSNEQTIAPPDFKPLLSMPSPNSPFINPTTLNPFYPANIITSFLDPMNPQTYVAVPERKPFVDGGNACHQSRSPSRRNRRHRRRRSYGQERYIRDYSPCRRRSMR
ncbi:hypothetical protein ACOME3_001732 [Neoechinorhynchus agilis]